MTTSSDVCEYGLCVTLPFGFDKFTVANFYEDKTTNKVIL